MGWRAIVVMTSRRLVILRHRYPTMTSNYRMRFDIAWSTVRATSSWSGYQLALVHEPASAAYPDRPIRRTRIALLVGGDQGAPKRMIELAQLLTAAGDAQESGALAKPEQLWEFPTGSEFLLSPEPPHDFLQEALDHIMGTKRRE
jgi:hypothetical protein